MCPKPGYCSPNGPNIHPDNVSMQCIFHLILVGLPCSLILFVKNRLWSGFCLKSFEVWHKLFDNGSVIIIPFKTGRKTIRFCNDTITSVTSVFLSLAQIERCRSTRKVTKEIAKAVQGTRRFYHFMSFSYSENSATF